MTFHRRVLKDRLSVTTHRTISLSAALGLRVPASLCAGAFLLLAALPSAFAQGKLDARYQATLSGIPVGSGAWTIDISDDQFSASASGGTAGLLKAFASGSGTGAAQGRVVNGYPLATNYSASTTTSKKTEAIHMVLSNGNVREYGIEPAPPVDPDRLPITDAHRRGVFDPMTGSMLRAPAGVDPLSPEVCRTGAPIFDGRMRYDLNLDFKRVEMVRAERGYHGPALVCAVYFSPVAGYIPDRPVIKYLAAQRNIEIAFVPVAGTRILVPFWMRIPTPLGPATLEATQFITQATPPRVAKTQ
jgi:hypothetical protein